MSVPVSTKTSRKPNLDLEDGIEYPSSDGKPMGETGTHARVALVSIYGVLDRYFMNNPRVAVHANMFMYYVQGDPKRNVCPDAFVARVCRMSPTDGPTRSGRRGKGPTWCFEVTSRKTRKQDLTKKFEIYRDVLRVREYFLFDPFEEYLDPSLQGYRLVAGSYEPIPMIKGGMPSEVLGRALVGDVDSVIPIPRRHPRGAWPGSRTATETDGSTSGPSLWTDCPGRRASCPMTTGLDGCDRFSGHEKSRETNFCPPRPNAWKGLRLTPHDAPAEEQGRRNVRLLGDTEQLVDGRGLPARRKALTTCRWS